jgi:hypothetical protein
MGVMQVQWRSLNVDHDWLVRVLPAMQPGMGMSAALDRVRAELPAVEHGNFTRPWPAAFTRASPAGTTMEPWTPIPASPTAPRRPSPRR